MKKILLFIFLFSLHFAYAGTGSANDVFLFYLVILAPLVFILAVYFFIDFIKSIMKKRREKEATQPDDIADNHKGKTPEIFCNKSPTAL